MHAGIPPLPTPGADTPWEQIPREKTPPSGADPSGADPPEEDTPPEADNTPLRSACWEIRPTSRRYASYWNVIFF